MEQFIGCDAHKKFSVFVAVNEKGQAGEALRVVHDRMLIREFLNRLPVHLTHKTDKLDARGLAILLRNGTLPEVWIPPAKIRDLRGLLRCRLGMRSHTTVIKN